MRLNFKYFNNLCKSFAVSNIYNSFKTSNSWFSKKKTMRNKVALKKLFRDFFDYFIFSLINSEMEYICDSSYYKC